MSAYMKFLNSKLLLESQLYLLGSGNYLDIDGETAITNKDRKLFRENVTETYYKSLGDITYTVIGVLNRLGITPVYNDEEWTGTFSGAISAGEIARLRIELIKDGKHIKNSMLIMNIYKMEGNSISYELNAYLS